MGGDWAKSFLELKEREGVSRNTLILYRSICKTIRNRYDLDLAICTPQQLDEAFTRMRRQMSDNYYCQCVIVAKSVLKHINRKKFANRLVKPKRPDRATLIKEQLLSPEERKQLIEKSPTPPDRLLLELLDELGARRGELANLKMKSVQFDEYGAILTLTGKTGTRRRRVYAAVPDLRAHVNNHPMRDNPEAPLFLSSAGQGYSGNTIWRRVRALGLKILSRPIHPHQFRHSRATEDSRHFTDRELMQLYGWRDPNTVSVYSHLSMRDVEDKDLMVHGFKSKEEILRPISQARRCGRCGGENAPVAMYCAKCGEVLATQDLDKLMADRKFMEQFVNHPTFQDTLRKALAVKA